MNILLILFLLSLSLIAAMIGRKLMIIRRGDTITLHHEDVLFEIPYIKEVKTITAKNARKYGYLGLVATIRLYLRSTSLVKYFYRDTKVKIKDVIEKNKNRLPLSARENQEISKFLKSISDYKGKIKKIKYKIKEEEGF